MVIASSLGIFEVIDFTKCKAIMKGEEVFIGTTLAWKFNDNRRKRRGWGKEKEEGGRGKGKGKREKGEREKGKGKREKEKGKRDKSFINDSYKLSVQKTKMKI